MARPDPRVAWLERLELNCLTPGDAAGLLQCSLPVPPGVTAAPALAGCATSALPLGQWPEATGPRRWLLAGDCADAAPATLRLGDAPAPTTAPPTAEAVLFATCPEEDFAWDRHYLKLSWGGQALGLVMGMRVGAEVHWWEGCRLVTIAEDAHCRTVEMGGVIPRDLFGAADVERWPGHENPYLHKHNWLNGVIHARLHANGVCEIFAHHINSRYVDDGCDLQDVVPVLGFRWFGPAPAVPPGPFDGSHAEWRAGEVRLDLREVARLATAKEPGEWFQSDEFQVLQPYLGCSLYSGIFGKQRLGTPWLYRGEQRIWPRGVARTLRFSLSLNPARSPRIARYLAPAWWYGACAEVTPRPYLPVRNEFDEVVEGALRYPAAHIVQGGFEDGCLPRAARQAGEERHETSWEGELPAAMLVQSWLRQSADEHARALRACYFFTDIAVDHAMRLVRMHGYLPPAISLPMQRVHACVLGWLETGDPYLGETARAVVANAYLLHKNSWPRLATGRDACSIRGAILLYRYTGDRHYLTLGRDMIADVIATQQPDGSFRDQGGGTGIHGWGAYITKPWMCCMAVGGMLDYLDLVPEDEAVAASVLRLADWLLAERWFHHGVRGWSYKHFCKGGRRQYSPREGGELKLPTPDLWHSDYLARILPWASERTGNPAYFDAFMESFNAKSERERRGDHAVAQSLQFLPWLQARLWRVELGAKGLTAAPVHYGERTPATGTVLTPEGEVTLRWTATGKLTTHPTGKLRRRAQP